MKEKIREIIRELVFKKLSIWDGRTDWVGIIEEFTNKVMKVIDEG